MKKNLSISATTAVEELEATDHHISQQKARTMTREYRHFRKLFLLLKQWLCPQLPDIPICVSYNVGSIAGLLAQKDCAGIRIYPCINADNAVSFVLAGFDSTGNNILDKTGGSMTSRAVSKSGGLVNEGQCCPPYPAGGSGF